MNENRTFILPVITLLIAVSMLGVQRKSISGIRSGNAVLCKKIAVVRKAGRAPDASFSGNIFNRKSADEKPIDWDELADVIRDKNAEKRLGDPLGMVSIQRRLLAMDVVELMAGLDRIAAMDLDDETRRKLEDMIMDPLAKKDPELALNRFKGRLAGSPGIDSLLLSSAIGLWAEKDLGTATAWLDREISTGTFAAKSLDGYNRNLEWFESKIISRMFATDPAGAEARLSTLPPAMRKHVRTKAERSE